MIESALPSWGEVCMLLDPLHVILQVGDLRDVYK